MQDRRIDARKLPKTLQQELMLCALSIRKSDGSMKQKDIARACGVSEPTVSRWMRRDAVARICKLAETKRIHRRSLNSGLSYGQIARLGALTKAYDAEGVLKFAQFSKWDIRLLVRNEFGVVIDSKSADMLMRKLGLPCRLPSAAEIQQDVLKFLEDNSCEWYRLQAIADAVEYSPQLTSRALTQLVQDGVIRSEEIKDSHMNTVHQYRAMPQDTGIGLAALFGLVPKEGGAKGRVVQGRDMKD